MGKVPEPTIKRLFSYYRCLKYDNNDMIPDYICSDKFGEKLGIKSTLLRRDLSFIGHLGQKGKGYKKDKLEKNLEKIIGLNKEWEIALVGAGNLGKALLRYDKFREMGLYITEVFDNDLDKIGRNLGGCLVKNVKSINKIINKKGIKIVILAIQQDDIEGVLQELRKTNIKAIWNLSSAHIDLGDDIIVIREDLCCSLGSFICKINK
jgi:redox-sensing transcriptional repressor